MPLHFAKQKSRIKGEKVHEKESISRCSSLRGSHDAVCLRKQAAGAGGKIKIS